MGEMACYEETCPQCGRVPSCRKKEADKYKESLEILRKEVKIFLIHHDNKHHLMMICILHAINFTRTSHLEER